MSHYHDLLQPDGSVNAAVFAEILLHRVTAEINLRRCLDARMTVPRAVSLGDVPAWYAGQCDAMHLPDLAPDEVDRITRQQTDALNHWVGAMATAAAQQRAAMVAA